MKRSKFSEEQIVYAIRKAESGTPIGDLCPQLGVSATFYTCKKKYAHLGVSELRRLRQVEEENSRLKRLVAYRSIMELNSNHALWRIGPIGEAFSSTSFVPASRGKRLYRIVQAPVFCVYGEGYTLGECRLTRSVGINHDRGEG